MKILINILVFLSIFPFSIVARADEDPAEVVIGERLFLETRFSQFFASRSNGDANAVLTSRDPVVELTKTVKGKIPGPFAGLSMNCRSCHLVDEPRSLGSMLTRGSSKSDNPESIRNIKLNQIFKST